MFYFFLIILTLLCSAYLSVKGFLSGSLELGIAWGIVAVHNLRDLSGLISISFHTCDESCTEEENKENK